MYISCYISNHVTTFSPPSCVMFGKEKKQEKLERKFTRYINYEWKFFAGIETNVLRGGRINFSN